MCDGSTYFCNATKKHQQITVSSASSTQIVVMQTYFIEDEARQNNLFNDSSSK